jgi:peptide-methionine (S)-S-oxide reductase
LFGLFGPRKPLTLPTAATALPGRATPLRVAERHLVTGAPMRGPWPGMSLACFGMGCFWGAERKLWQTPGVVCTAAGYAGGLTPNATYDEVCSGRTGHTEVVLAVWDPSKVSYEALLRLFWEAHDPTQGMRQGNDVGTQYRSAVYTYDQAQLDAAIASRDAYQTRLTTAGFGGITTEIAPAGEVFYAEDEHQQYLFKNPGGYCGIGGTGVSCPVGTGA